MIKQNKPSDADDYALCFRCEKRALYLEGRPGAFRSECKNVNIAVGGCYQFTPIKPIALAPRKGDNRPLSLNLLSCRVERVPVEVNLELYPCVNKKEVSTIPCWIPKEIIKDFIKDPNDK